MNISIHELTVSYRNGGEVVGPLNLDIEKGERIGIIGESGAGKSTLIKGIFGNLVHPVDFSGEVCLCLENGETERVLKKRGPKSHFCLAPLKRIWGSQVSFIFQEPLVSLSPYYSLARQMDDLLYLAGEREPEIRKKELFKRAQFPLQRTSAFPAELSGGENQRACIAMAMVVSPSVLVADEPTTGLDLSIQKRVLQTLLCILNEYRDTSLLFVTHSLELLNQVLQGNGKLLVFYQGRLLEQVQYKDAPLSRHLLFHHPYATRLFLNAQYPGFFPMDDFWADFLEELLPKNRETISPDILEKRGKGCLYLEECPFAKQMQKNASWKDLFSLCRFCPPEMRPVEGPFLFQSMACHLFQNARGLSRLETFLLGDGKVAEAHRTSKIKRSDLPGDAFELLRTEKVCTGYRDGQPVIHDLSFSLRRGNHLGIVGETGSGKSSLARALSGVPVSEQWVRGKIEWDRDGKWADISTLQGIEKRKYRNLNQLIWQQPSEVFPPGEDIGTLLRDACRVWAELWRVRERKNEEDSRMKKALDDLCLCPSDGLSRFLSLTPENLSGGQRKRLLLARTLLSCGYPRQTPGDPPRVLYIDEPLRGIDGLNTGLILECLERACLVLNATLVVITHDLRVLHRLCREIMVVYHGELLEYAPALSGEKMEVERSHHPYTLELIRSIPRLDVFWENEPFLEGGQSQSGCVYRPQCARYPTLPPAMALLCEGTRPSLARCGTSWVACHAV